MLNDDTLNATDVAAILHIGKNAVYQLAKTGELPSYKMGRKILFSLKDVQRYMESRRFAPHAEQAPASSIKPSDVEDAFVIAGQGIACDLIVDRLQTLGMPAFRKPCGSYTGLVDIYQDQANASLVHLFDQRTNSYNIPYVQRLAPGTPVVVYRLIQRWQGFAVAEGNPKSISSWGSLLRDNIRLANRQKGCGSRILLDEKLMAMEANPYSIPGYGTDYATGLAAAQAVATGAADVAVVGEQIALQIDGIDFVRLQSEWLDIVVAKNGRGRELVRALRSFFSDTSFKREYGRIVHGNDESLGAIVYEC